MIRDPTKIRFDMSKREILYQWSYYRDLLRELLTQRPDDVVEQYNFLRHLFLFSDILEEDPDVPTILKTTKVELSLLIPEWLGFMLCHFNSAYSVGARTLRWMYESAVASTASILDGSIFFNAISVGAPLSLQQFKK